MHAELVDGAYNAGYVHFSHCTSVGSKLQWTALRICEELEASADRHLAGFKRFLTLWLFLVSDLISQESNDPDAQSSFLPADQ